MKKTLIAAGFLTAIILLIGCGSSPESLGKDLAEKACKCGEMKEDMEYEADKKMYETLLEDFKNNKIKTRSEYINRKNDLEYTTNDKGAKEDVEKCGEELQKGNKAAMLKFVKDEDRRTFQNAAEANMAACRDNKREKNKARNENLNAIKTEVNDFVSRLSYY